MSIISINRNLNSQRPLVRTSSAATLTDLLIERFHTSPNREIYHFLGNSTNSPRLTLTYKDLYQRAATIANELHKKNPGREPVLLLYNCDLDYISAFFGCLLAGQIAVPAYPPTASKHFDRLQTIIDNANAKIALSNTEIHTCMNLIDPDKTAQLTAEVIKTDLIPLQSQLAQTPRINKEDIAFLQYTSGSTGNPKGVMLSHRALMSNLDMIRNRYEYTTEDRLLMWLPLYHDMGLIGGVLQAIFADAPLFFMPPHSVVRPFRWLKALSDYKATATGAPNFALEMCLHRISDAEVAQLDLSHLRFICSGAEPVRPETLRKFNARFSSTGLHPNVIAPSYGMAEVCVFGTAPKMRSPIKITKVDGEALKQGVVRKPDLKTLTTQEFVACGHLADGTQCLVVNPETLEKVSAHQVGELLLSGDHMMSGYWREPQKTAETMIIVDGKTYIRSGDLVFFDEEQNLFICGRHKDLIILRGKNYYAADLEMTAQLSHELLKDTVTAAFSIDQNGQEKLILIQELPAGVSLDKQNEIKNQITIKTLEEHLVAFDDIVFTSSGTIRRTSSGKVRRRATKELYENRKIRTYAIGFRNSKQLVALKRSWQISQMRFFATLAQTSVVQNWVARKEKKKIKSHLH